MAQKDPQNNKQKKNRNRKNKKLINPNGEYAVTAKTLNGLR